MIQKLLIGSPVAGRFLQIHVCQDGSYMFTYASALVSPVLKVETFADRKFHGSPEREIFAFRAHELSRMTNIQKFRGHKHSRVTTFQ